MKCIDNIIPHVEHLANNQVIVVVNGYRYFFSYSSLISVVPSYSNDIYLTNKWDYSATTLRWLKKAHSKFDGVAKKDIQRMLDKGEGVYHYEDLKCQEN